MLFVDYRVMKKLIASVLCFASLTHAIEIDIPFVKEQAKYNKLDINNRVLLVKYYMQQGDSSQALQYADEILAVDAQNAFAKVAKSRLTLTKKLQKVSGKKGATIAESLQALYDKKSYASFIKNYEIVQAQGIALDAKMDLNAAFAYYELGDIDKSSRLLQSHAYTKSKKIEALKQKILLAKAEKHVSTSKKPQAFNDYVYLLNKNGNKKATIQKLQSFVKAHPENSEAKIALAQNLYWAGDLKKAFHTLYAVRNTHDMSKTLYGNILYEMGDYAHAIYFLPEAVKKAKSVKARYSLEKRTAFTYMHLGKKTEAEAIFSKLLKQNPQDKEITSYLDTVQTNALLSDAVSAHKAKNMSQALALYTSYYEKKNDPKIAKEIAEIYYFNQKEKLSLPYFKTYLEAFPMDTLIRFHYASALEKNKMYHDSVPEFKMIVDDKNAKEYYLAKYHYSNSLMHTYQDADWILARKELGELVTALEKRAYPKEKSLLKYAHSLYKTALGKIRKPTRYKDIILTEGSYKIVAPTEVFSMEDIRFTQNPSVKSLLSIKKRDKRAVWMGMDYVSDSDIKHYNHIIGVDNLLVSHGVAYGMEVERFDFRGKVHKYDGTGIFLKAKKEKFAVELGLEHFDDFDTIVPKVSWTPALGSHMLYMEAYYRNGAFVNYRDCMVENEVGVYHLGLYDSILLDNLTKLDMGIDYNHFEDGNNNIYGQFTYPLISKTWLGVEHGIVFNENLEYNSKTTVCSHPVEFYDTTYLKYKPKFYFNHGSIDVSAGLGYAFNNQEMVYSYGLNGVYSIEKFATLSLNCERLQSSFTSDNMTFCHFNVIQDW